MSKLREKLSCIEELQQAIQYDHIIHDIVGIMREICYSRLDGSMPFADRQINITKFKSNPKCMVFLVSTRAAGLGLNLTAADTVIIYDSDWVSGVWDCKVIVVQILLQVYTACALFVYDSEILLFHIPGY